MENILREIDNRIAHKRAEIIKKDLERLSQETENNLKYFDCIKKKYHTILDKDKPVGKALPAIRYLKNFR
jgi:hypothetical protein